MTRFAGRPTRRNSSPSAILRFEHSVDSIGHAFHKRAPGIGRDLDRPAVVPSHSNGEPIELTRMGIFESLKRLLNILYPIGVNQSGE
jgi:hypothetical protein